MEISWLPGSLLTPNGSIKPGKCGGTSTDSAMRCAPAAIARFRASLAAEWGVWCGAEFARQSARWSDEAARQDFTLLLSIGVWKVPATPDLRLWDNTLITQQWPSRYNLPWFFNCPRLVIYGLITHFDFYLNTSTSTSTSTSTPTAVKGIAIELTIILMVRGAYSRGNAKRNSLVACAEPPISFASLGGV